MRYLALLLALLLPCTLGGMFYGQFLSDLGLTGGQLAVIAVATFIAYLLGILVCMAVDKL